ncbi:MAG: hypothetical protein GY936_14285 [Ignavibacteriae bacterium]|nr:hypothetical protein [Ignavibacteriota bacterium]
MTEFKIELGVILCTLLFAIFFTACSGDKIDVKNGEMEHIPYTNNYAIGTDSTIVIINRETGETLNIIKRTYKSK